MKNEFNVAVDCVLIRHQPHGAAFCKDIFMSSSSWRLNCVFISLIYDSFSRKRKGDIMDANWLTFGAAILGLVVAAVVVYKKGQQS